MTNARPSDDDFSAFDDLDLSKSSSDSAPRLPSSAPLRDYEEVDDLEIDDDEEDDGFFSRSDASRSSASLSQNREFLNKTPRNAAPQPSDPLDRVGIFIPGDSEMKYCSARKIYDMRRANMITDSTPVWVNGEECRLRQVWKQLERRALESTGADLLPPGAYKRVGLLIDNEMKYYTTRELYEMVKRGRVRSATPVYLNDVQYTGRDFWEQLNQTPFPEYFVVPKRTQSYVLLEVFFGFVIAVVAITAIVIAFTRGGDDSAPSDVASNPPVDAPETEPEATTSDASDESVPAPPTSDSESKNPDATDSKSADRDSTEIESQEPETTASETDGPTTPASEPTSPSDTTSSDFEIDFDANSDPDAETMPIEPVTSEPQDQDATSTVTPEPEPEPEPESEPTTPKSTPTEPSPSAPETPDAAPASSPETSSSSSAEPTVEPATTSDAESRLLTEPFDVNQTSLPKNFIGHSFTQVRDALLRPEFRSPRRDANESDEDYAARVGQAEYRAGKTPLFGTVMPTSRLAFMLPNFEMVRKDPERYRGMEYVTTEHYDKATQTLSVGKSFGGFSVSFFDSLHIAPFLLSRGSYGLALEAPSEFGFSWANSDSYHWKIKGLPMDRYEKMKDTICLLCVLTVDYRKPGETGLIGASGNFALYSREVEFWLYDAATGEVLGKFSFDDTLEETPHEYRFGRVSPGSAALKINRRSLKPDGATP